MFKKIFISPPFGPGLSFSPPHPAGMACSPTFCFKHIKTLSQNHYDSDQYIFPETHTLKVTNNEKIYKEK